MEPNWSRKGATLSDKSARQEFGLTQQEIIVAIRAGKLQYREGSMHGNPRLRLLRHEVEALVKEKGGQDHLHRMKLQKDRAYSHHRSRRPVGAGVVDAWQIRTWEFRSGYDCRVHDLVPSISGGCIALGSQSCVQVKE